MNTNTVDFFQSAPGHGKQGPPDPDGWELWKSKPGTPRHEVRQLAINHHIRRRGGLPADGSPYTFTLWHWREGDPVHENGRPKRVHAVTLTAARTLTA